MSNLFSGKKLSKNAKIHLDGALALAALSVDYVLSNPTAIADMKEWMKKTVTKKNSHEFVEWIMSEPQKFEPLKRLLYDLCRVAAENE